MDDHFDEAPLAPAGPPRAEPAKDWLTADESSSGLSDTAQKRRDQIMDAAEAIIAGEGIHKLSLGRIEGRLGGMSRGQLTYYFPNKESILLAVYERMIRRIIAQLLQGDGPKPLTGHARECFEHSLAQHLRPEGVSETVNHLFILLYTFLAQMGHRPDYRNRLSAMYAAWRAQLVADITGSVPEPRPVPPPVAASILQALIHGLTMQLAVDPNAFDRAEMLAACMRLLAPVFAPTSTRPQPAGESP